MRDAPPTPAEYRKLATRRRRSAPDDDHSKRPHLRRRRGHRRADAGDQRRPGGNLEGREVSIWHAGNHDNPFGLRLTTLMISKRLPDSAVPMSLLADHPNVQFNFYRGGIGTCAIGDALGSRIRQNSDLACKTGGILANSATLGLRSTPELAMKRAFAVAAHPDDIEFVMAGTLILLSRAGYEIHYMNIANGCCGSTRAWRRATRPRFASRKRCEAAEADWRGVPSAASSTTWRSFTTTPTLCAPGSGDARGGAGDSADPCADRLHGRPHERLPAGGHGGLYARHAQLLHESVTAASPTADVTVYHAQPHGNRDPLGQVVRPNIFVDVETVIDLKTAMLNCHRSQQGWLDASQGLSSYITTMHELMAEVGQMSGRFRVAEGWRRHLHYGYCAADADPLTMALRPLVYVAGE